MKKVNVEDWAQRMGCAEIKGDVTVYKYGEFVKPNGKTILGQFFGRANMKTGVVVWDEFTPDNGNDAFDPGGIEGILTDEVVCAGSTW